MNLFDFFKKKNAPAPVTTSEDKDIAPPDSSPLSHTGNLLTMEEKLENFYQLPTRSNLIEIAKILSNNAPQAVEEFTLLVNDSEKFYQKHQEYCDENYDGAPQSWDILSLTADWLTGQNMPVESFKYGGFIDWKETTKNILWHLEQAKEQLGYPLSLTDIKLTKERPTNEVLHEINQHLSKQGYTLATLNIHGDCYHLFMVPKNQYLQLYNLGQEIGFEFYEDYI